MLPAAAFTRQARHGNLTSRHSYARPLIRLEADAFDPPLRTHKLKGQWGESWACSVAYDLRIVFRFVEPDGAPSILLQALGTHDEVY